MNHPLERPREEPKPVHLWEGPSSGDAGVAMLSDLIEIDALEASQVSEIGELTGLKTASALAEEMSRRGWLTTFQAERAVEGSARTLSFGPYLLMEEIGQGGMGRVYKAKHRIMGRMVAIKVIRPEFLAHPQAVDRFHREVQAMALLSHEHIVTAYDAAQVDGQHFLVMEFVDGVDLARLIRDRGPLPVELVCQVGRQASLGLHHAHSRGLVHRDIKPSNLLATHEGQVKLLDLGLAKLWGESPAEGGNAEVLTHVGTILGTPDYISPEQINDPSQTGPRSDQYSLGCTLYHLLAGRPPFPGGTSQDKFARHREIDPPPLEGRRPDVGRELAAAIRRMMAKRPEDRFADLAETAEVFAALARPSTPYPAIPAVLIPPNLSIEDRWTAAETDGDPPPRAAEAEPRLAPGGRGRPRKVWVAGVAFALLAALGVFVVRAQSERGTLVVKVADPDAEVTVDGVNVTVDLQGTGRVELRPGAHQLRVRRGDEEILTREFTLRRQGVEVIEARWEPAPGLEAGKTPAAPHRYPPTTEAAKKEAAEHAKLAYTLEKQARYEECIAELDLAIKLTPLDLWLRTSRAHWLAYLKRYDEALTEYDRIFEIDPNDPIALDRRAAFWVGRGNDELALADLNRCIRFSPTNPVGYLGRANLRARKGELDTAIADFTKLISIDLKSAPAYIGRGQALRRKGELARAVADFTAAIEVNPKDPLPYHERAATLIEMGQDERGRADDREADRLSKLPH